MAKSMEDRVKTGLLTPAWNAIKNEYGKDLTSARFKSIPDIGKVIAQYDQTITNYIKQRPDRAKAANILTGFSKAHDEFGAGWDKTRGDLLKLMGKGYLEIWPGPDKNAPPEDVIAYLNEEIPKQEQRITLLKDINAERDQLHSKLVATAKKLRDELKATTASVGSATKKLEDDANQQAAQIRQIATKYEQILMKYGQDEIFDAIDKRLLDKL